jgi:hypothetical protein
VGEAVAVQVAHQPPPAGAGLDVAQERRQLPVGHVVGDLHADDDVEGLRLVAVVARAVVDGEVGRGGDPRGPDALRVQVDPDQLRRDPPAPSPARDRAQDVAVAEADVEQPEPLRRPDRPVEEREHGPRRGRPAVQAGEVVQDALVDGRVEVRSVHLLLLPRPPGQVGHLSRPSHGLSHTSTP